MPGRARAVEPVLPVQIIQRGHNRASVFFSGNDCWKTVNDLQAAAEKSRCAIHSQVLMTNQVLMVASWATHGSLAKWMKSVGSRYMRFVNTKTQRSGTLWESRYKSALIDAEPYRPKSIEAVPGRSLLLHRRGGDRQRRPSSKPPSP